MSINLFSTRIVQNLIGVDGVSSGDYDIIWYLNTPWLSVEDLSHIDPLAIPLLGLDTSLNVFDPGLYSDWPPGFMPPCNLQFAVTNTDSGEPPFSTITVNDGHIFEVQFNFNEYWFDSDPGTPIDEVRAAIAWILQNRGLYLRASVFSNGPPFPPSSTVRDGFQIHDDTMDVDASPGSPIAVTRSNGTYKQFLFPFTIGGAAPTLFWTNLKACVEDL